jgi:hypothetical protein
MKAGMNSQEAIGVVVYGKKKREHYVTWYILINSCFMVVEPL